MDDRAYENHTNWLKRFKYFLTYGQKTGIMQNNIENVKLFNDEPILHLQSHLPKELIHSIILPYHQIHCPSIFNILTDDFEFYFDNFLHINVGSSITVKFYQLKISLSSTNESICFTIPLCRDKNNKNNNEYDFDPLQYPLFAKNVHVLDQLFQCIHKNEINCFEVTTDNFLSYLNFKSIFRPIKRHDNGDNDTRFDFKLGPFIGRTSIDDQDQSFQIFVWGLTRSMARN